MLFTTVDAAASDRGDCRTSRELSASEGLTKGERSMDIWHLSVAMASGYSKASCCTGAADYMDVLEASRRFGA